MKKWIALGLAAWFLIAILIWAGSAEYLSPQYGEKLHDTGSEFRTIAVFMFSAPFAIALILGIRSIYLRCKMKKQASHYRDDYDKSS
jgi:hypothetical protein